MVYFCNSAVKFTQYKSGGLMPLLKEFLARKQVFIQMTIPNRIKCVSWE